MSTHRHRYGSVDVFYVDAGRVVAGLGSLGSPNLAMLGAFSVASGAVPLEAVMVMDRALSLETPSPPLASNVKSALYDEGIRTPVLSVVYCLGGREPTTSMVSKLLNKVREWVEGGSVRSRVLYLGAGGEWT